MVVGIVRNGIRQRFLLMASEAKTAVDTAAGLRQDQRSPGILLEQHGMFCGFLRSIRFRCGFGRWLPFIERIGRKIGRGRFVFSS